ncbi:Bug family tripartite tricarboxylate transporter substrate binding protein [Pigmentiphaga litoralis]|uniref:Bug family tripartite tricarboxylate transporter substrate binding protein n=1 Tax=Pigmentiphaga litoralis TaxID=516702 RepID=UPI003B42C43E
MRLRLRSITTGIASWVMAGSLIASVAGTAMAQPASRTVRLVVPFAAGGPADVIARKIADRLGPQLNTVVVVDSRPGANGVIGVQAVSKAPPDGSVLLFATSGMLTISPALYKDLSYDPLRDLTPIARVVANGSALLVNKQVPANTIQEFVAYAAKSSTPVAIGSAGTGNITHLYLELLKESTRANLVHVPYKGVAPALADVMGGQIAGVFVDLPAALPLLKAGSVKALGMVGDTRSPAAPDIPTIAEQGCRGVDGVSWFGVLGPAGMPAPAVERVHAALARVLSEPDVVKSLQDIGSVPSLDTPQEMRKLIAEEQVRWAGLIKARNITVD